MIGEDDGNPRDDRTLEDAEAELTDALERMALLYEAAARPGTAAEWRKNSAQRAAGAGGDQTKDVKRSDAVRRHDLTCDLEKVGRCVPAAKQSPHPATQVRRTP